MFANFGLVLASSYSSVAPPEILNECLDHILGLLSVKGGHLRVPKAPFGFLFSQLSLKNLTHGQIQKRSKLVQVSTPLPPHPPLMSWSQSGKTSNF